MLTRKVVLALLLLSLFVGREVNAFEPFSSFTATAMAGMASMMYGTYEFFRCRRFECCTQRWIMNNSTGLKQDLQEKLYGQHLVAKAVYRHVKGHVNPDFQPLKALALSFHGDVGTGKNHVARIIARNLYKKGLKSEFVHLFCATREFPHPSRVDEYKERIRQVIETNVRNCPQSLFIFDEMEKVPMGLIDTIRPYLQPYDSLNGVDYRRAIFLFLGNIGGELIDQYTMNHWKAKKNREDIKLSDVEPLLELSSLRSEGGFMDSDLILNQFMTASIPFLPLNTTHVQQCIEDILVERKFFERGKIPKAFVDKVMGNLHFLPESEKVFSVTGCKRVVEKVDFEMFSDF